MAYPSISFGSDSKEIEDLIETCLQHFVQDDAIILAEAYYYKTKTEHALFILAQCLLQAGKIQGCYQLLKKNGFVLHKCRYLFAKCAYSLNKLQEAEAQLTDERFTNELHSCFENTSTFPFASSLLSKIYEETNRAEQAKALLKCSLEANSLIWSNIARYSNQKQDQNLEDVFSKLLISRLGMAKKTVNGACWGHKKKMEDLASLKTPEMGPKKKIQPRRLNKKKIETKTPEISSIYGPKKRIPVRFQLRWIKTPTSAAYDDDEEPMELENSDPVIRAEISHENEEVEKKQTTQIDMVVLTNLQENAEQQQQEIIETNVDTVYCDVADSILQMGLVLEQLARFNCKEALELLEGAPQTLSELPMCMELRARIFFENGEYRRACDVLERLRRKFLYRITAMDIYSTALWHLRESHQLSALTAELTNTDREEPESWCVAANCFSLEKEHETAIECLERAIRLNPKFGYAFSLLGQELIILSNLKRSSEAFRQALQCSPNDYRAWYGLGLVCYKEEKHAQARFNLIKAANINPRNIVVLCQLAVVEQALNETNSAMIKLKTAMKCSPNNVACQYHYARLLFDEGHYAEALERLVVLQCLSPDEANVFYLLGRVHRKLKNHHVALVNYSWATEIDPRGEQNHSSFSDHRAYDDEPIDLMDYGGTLGTRPVHATGSGNLAANAANAAAAATTTAAPQQPNFV